MSPRKGPASLIACPNNYKEAFPRGLESSQPLPSASGSLVKNCTETMKQRRGTRGRAKERKQPRASRRWWRLCLKPKIWPPAARCRRRRAARFWFLFLMKKIHIMYISINVFIVAARKYVGVQDSCICFAPVCLFALPRVFLFVGTIGIKVQVCPQVVVWIGGLEVWTPGLCRE